MSERARYAPVYAVALNSSGRVDDALKILKEALIRHPNDRDVRAALTSIGQDAGGRR